MTVWTILLTLWSGGSMSYGRDYTSEAECLQARHVMAIRHGTLECKPTPRPGI